MYSTSSEHIAGCHLVTYTVYSTSSEHIAGCHLVTYTVYSTSSEHIAGCHLVTYTVYSTSSEHIAGVSLGFKTVRVHNPDPEVDDDDRQVRPCMVVLVTNNDPGLCNNELTPPIVENVLAVIQQRHPNTSHYAAEEGSPHWLRFILYKPEYEVVEHL